MSATSVIEPVDPRDEAVFLACHAVYAAAHGEEWDRPYTARELRAELVEAGPYVDKLVVAARDEAGTVVAMGWLEMPQRDNRSLGYVDVAVHPDHRRRGHGSRVLSALQGLAESAGRDTLFAEARWDVAQEGAGHTAFAEAHGFHRDMVDAQRVLTLPADLPEAPVQDGYALQAWREECPERWLEQHARLLSLIVQEAPSGDYPLENEYFDAARIRSDERLLMAQGRVMQTVAAESPDGELVGHTQLVFSQTDAENAYQWDTLVLPEHRGHGLGLSLKVAAMRAASDLLMERRFVHTYNAARNGPMIAVNDAMGYRLVAYVGEYIREAGT
ncbi:hypothetical protein C6I20_01695 [Aeromicrobium sp. A1-2]|uniref:GNAT family N-acetyltransferase n=1 Tax=Aeromicrobium sp. A1-2 TaxID=2107713 RepID=UPI000E5398C1|nr:GNAT family N-acetyltransferase [Aeromicrobium sp. A1-2]AXT84032.1 hypothetical protein C6I20_01695 [Aeromicrobium sp. A1-2]